MTDRMLSIYEAVSLDHWRTLDHKTQMALLPPNADAVKPRRFNKQESDAIEWAQWSWNPITGCLHDCPYCYARDVALGRAASAYPYGFLPALRPASLLAPRHMQVPAAAAADTRYRNVFTGSMADVFGRWVPREWIETVLAAVRAAPQWNFLCLTKFPKRMAEFEIPANAWMGTTVDLQARVPAAEAGFAKIGGAVR
jgi:protein gp37